MVIRRAWHGRCEICSHTSNHCEMGLLYEKRDKKIRVLIRLRWPEVVKMISKVCVFTEFGCGKYPLGHVERHLTPDHVVYVFGSNFHCIITFRTFLSVPHDSFTDTSWTFELAHMTWALWIVLTCYLNKQEGPVTTLPYWCRRVISRHTDGKAASSSMCNRPRHTVALVVNQVSLPITSVAGKVSLFVVDSWLQHQVPLFAGEEVVTTAFAASQIGGPTLISQSITAFCLVPGYNRTALRPCPRLSWLNCFEKERFVSHRRLAALKRCPVAF